MRTGAKRHIAKMEHGRYRRRAQVIVRKLVFNKKIKQKSYVLNSLSHLSDQPSSGSRLRDATVNSLLIQS
jgi:hypothetical protein